MNQKGIKNGTYVLLGLVFVMLIGLNILCHDHWLDSDMAAEMMFSKLLAEEGHLIATPNWYYTTEFRILYTHLIMGPLFRIMDNWHVIRAVTNVAFYVMMFVSYIYVVKPLKISKITVLLTGIILLLPFSENVAQNMQMGNTYMSHVIILFVFFGLFLRLSGKKQKMGFRWTIMLCAYLVLALICGMSGIRYLLVMQCPLVIAALFYAMKSEAFQSFRQKMTKENWLCFFRSKEITFLIYALVGALGAVVGYVVNALWISKQYIFKTYEETNFISIYQGEFFDRLQDAIGSLLLMFGYIPDKGVISIRGLFTIIAFLLLGLIIYCTVKIMKRAREERKFWVLFLTASFVVNMFAFVFVTTSMTTRYFIPLFVFAIPVFAIYFEEEKIPFDRIAVGLLLAGCMFLCTAKTVFSIITSDKNADKRPVAEFLQESEYKFGYATYFDANIFTELTNGTVEIANVIDQATLEFYKWASPLRYYEEGYAKEEVFLLMTSWDYAYYSEAATVQNGEKVYDDGKYVVLLYDSVEELLSYRIQM